MKPLCCSLIAAVLIVSGCGHTLLRRSSGCQWYDVWWRSRLLHPLPNGTWLCPGGKHYHNFSQTICVAPCKATHSAVHCWCAVMSDVDSSLCNALSVIRGCSSQCINHAVFELGYAFVGLLELAAFVGLARCHLWGTQKGTIDMTRYGTLVTCQELQHRVIYALCSPSVTSSTLHCWVGKAKISTYQVSFSCYLFLAIEWNA